MHVYVDKTKLERWVLIREKSQLKIFIFLAFLTNCLIKSPRVPMVTLFFHDDVIKWKHFSALLAICEGNSPVTGQFPAQRPVTQSFDVFFDLCLNERLNKQSWGWWFETPSRPLWRQSDACHRFLRQHLPGMQTFGYAIISALLFVCLSFITGLMTLTLLDFGRVCLWFWPWIFEKGQMSINLLYLKKNVPISLKRNTSASIER